MELASKVDVEKSDPNSVRRDRLFKLDQTRLISVVEETLQRYGLDPRLLVEEGGGEENDHLSRCKYAYVSPSQIEEKLTQTDLRPASSHRRLINPRRTSCSDLILSIARSPECSMYCVQDHAQKSVGCQKSSRLPEQRSSS